MSAPMTDEQLAQIERDHAAYKDDVLNGAPYDGIGEAGERLLCAVPDLVAEVRRLRALVNDERQRQREAMRAVVLAPRDGETAMFVAGTDPLGRER